MILLWSLSYTGPGWFIRQEEGNKEYRLSTELRRRREKNITKCHIKINVKKWYKKKQNAVKANFYICFISWYFHDRTWSLHDRYMIVTWLLHYNDHVRIQSIFPLILYDHLNPLISLGWFLEFSRARHGQECHQDVNIKHKEHSFQTPDDQQINDKRWCSQKVWFYKNNLNNFNQHHSFLDFLAILSNTFNLIIFINP